MLCLPVKVFPPSWTSKILLLKKISKVKDSTILSQNVVELALSVKLHDEDCKINLCSKCFHLVCVIRRFYKPDLYELRVEACRINFVVNNFKRRNAKNYFTEMCESLNLIGSTDPRRLRNLSNSVARVLLTWNKCFRDYIARQHLDLHLHMLNRIRVICQEWKKSRLVLWG